LASASHAPLASNISEISVPMLETRDSERLQPASAMRLASASSGDFVDGVSAWISSWLSLLECTEGEGGFKKCTW
jgi:hypothetical protein